MVAMLFKIMFLGVAACLGAGAGWWIRGAGSKKESSVTPHPKSRASHCDFPPASAGTGHAPSNSDAIEVMMAKLQQLTANVAADVGEHSNKVQEINEELTAATADPRHVLAVVERLVEANGVMQSQLVLAESRLHEQAQEIETHVKEARTDALTKLWNRRQFDEELQKCKERLTNFNLPSCVMMLDVDHFKKFNDTYGHQAGDEVLKGVARTLTKAAGNNLVCRYGGEEFAIIFADSEISTVIPAAEQVRTAIAEQVFEFEGLDLKVTASSGLAQLREDESPCEVVKRSDDALYTSKGNGRNRGYWHDGHLSHPMASFSLELSGAEEHFVFAHEDSIEDHRDRICGVSDRASFLNDIDRRIAEWSRGGATLSVLLVEIDEYDRFRESRGDKAREVVLRAAAQFLKAAMREMDHIARYGDNVFGLLLPGTEVTETSSVAERLRTAIARCSLPIGGTKVKFTVSLGAAEVAKDDTDESLLSRAELSLTTAKKSGGNCSFVTTAAGDVRSMAVIA